MTDRARRRRIRRGFTLIDLMMTITIIIVAGVLVTPRLSDDKRMRLVAAASILASDIELAQVMSISHPNEPVVVSFDPANNSRYWLAYASDPATPMPRPDNGRPYLIVFGQDRARVATDVTFALTDITDDTLAFDPQGSVANISTQPVITLTTGTRSMDLQIASTTGTITQVE